MSVGDVLHYVVATRLRSKVTQSLQTGADHPGGFVQKEQRKENSGLNPFNVVLAEPSIGNE